MEVDYILYWEMGDSTVLINEGIPPRFVLYNFELKHILHKTNSP